MKIYTDEDLKNYSTMKIGGKKAYKIVVFEELAEFVSYVTTQKYGKNVFVLGVGSNTIFGSDVEEIWKLDFGNVEVRENTMEVEAGMDWDIFVQKYIDAGGVGMEALSKIPGTVGASPVQNIGAYGHEVSDFIKSVCVYDFETHSFKEIVNKDCGFAYRESIFKKENRRYVIFKVIFNIVKGEVKIPKYADVENYFKNLSIDTPTVGQIRDAIIEIREKKLPPPESIANCGSFFKNIIVDEEKMFELKVKIENLKVFEVENVNGDNSKKYKIPTAQILEHLGYKGKNADFSNGNFGFHVNHALVLVSSGKGDVEEFKNFVESVREDVKSFCDVDLEVEVNIL